MDSRTPFEKFLWNTIGEPLYYCKECLICVHVKEKDGVVTIKRNCEHNEAQIMAPRKSYLSGSGFAGLSTGNKIKVTYQQIAAKITGRNV
jgi:hypothetical protein